MNRGYVRLWRKSLDAGWLRNRKLWAFWTWCLLKASHKGIVFMVGFQEIALEPGQFVFGRNMAVTELSMTEREVRTCLDGLKKAGNVTIKTTNKFSIITIVNWSIYQGNDFENDHQSDQPPTNKGPQTNTKEHKKKTPNEISAEISDLTDKLFSSPEGETLFDRTIEAISSTRKSGKASPSVILNLLLKLEEYPEGRVLAGIRTYLEKEYFKQGKGERYLLGIIRNLKSGPYPTPELKSTGSSLLDAYYRGDVPTEYP